MRWPAHFWYFEFPITHRLHAAPFSLASNYKRVSITKNVQRCLEWHIVWHNENWQFFLCRIHFSNSTFENIQRAYTSSTYKMIVKCKQCFVIKSWYSPTNSSKQLYTRIRSTCQCHFNKLVLEHQTTKRDRIGKIERILTSSLYIIRYPTVINTL